MPRLVASMPLFTYPEPSPEPAIRAAVGLATAQGLGLDVSLLAVDVPPVASWFGSAILDVDGLSRAVEVRSRQDCARLQALIEGLASPGDAPVVAVRTLPMGAAALAAAVEARHHDAAVLPWSGEATAERDMAEALVFGAGVPVVLVPKGAPAPAIDHLAVGWDGSRVAARALADALRLFPGVARITVLTVRDEKPLAAQDIAARLVAALARRGHAAEAVSVPLAGQPIAVALQEAAAAAGAQLLAMGAFGHSRLRDFVLGSATAGVLADLRMPVLLSH